MSPNNTDINNNYNDSNNSDNNNKGLCNFVFPFESFRCGAYLRVALRRGRCLFQRNKNYANDTLKLSPCIFPNNNE